MKKIVIGTIIAAASLMAASFAPCAGCHGAAAEKPALGKSAVIKGWPVEKTVAALKGYKDGSYGGAMKGVMKGQVARLSDADIEDLAKQIAAF
ncbi:MAG: c-type cytochrome [Halarcobacter sp.]